MISKSALKRADLSIVVASGSGSATFQYIGHIKLLCFQPPSPAANYTYDYEITDQGSYGLNGRSANNGNLTIAGDILVDDLCTLTLSNATNGTYKVRLYIDLSA